MVAVSSPRGLCRFILLLVVPTFCPVLQGRFRPEQHVIVQSETRGPKSVYAADLDGDGDLDMLSAFCGYSLVLFPSRGTIPWHVNDGSGQFGPEHVITTVAGEVCSVYAADLDSDGDLDVLAASSSKWVDGYGKIAWYANDGTGRFSPPQAIATAADVAPFVYGAQSVRVVDLDGDGDLDILFASYAYDEKSFPVNGTIAWYANDGSGHFGAEQVVTTGTQKRING